MTTHAAVRECTDCGAEVPQGEPHPALCGPAASVERLRLRILAGFALLA